MNNWVSLRILRNLVQRKSERLAKFVAQVKALSLVPEESVLDISGRGWPN
jgi:hypothetical protein